MRQDIEKEAVINENGRERKSEWSTVSSTYNGKDIETEGKAWQNMLLRLKDILRSIREYHYSSNTNKTGRLYETLCMGF